MTLIQPTILIIDDDSMLGHSLKRLAAQSFPDVQVVWVRNGVAGLDMVRRQGDRVRLVMLDINMPLMDGNLVAAQIRVLAPHLPVMPFTSHAASLPALIEMGCVLPVVKHPQVFSELPARMREAMAMPIAPLPERAWITALRQSGNAVLAFVEQGMLSDALAADREAAVRVRQAVDLLDKYCGRFPSPAREVIQARKALQGVAVD